MPDCDHHKDVLCPSCSPSVTAPYPSRCSQHDVPMEEVNGVLICGCCMADCERIAPPLLTGDGKPTEGGPASDEHGALTAVRTHMDRCDEAWKAGRRALALTEHAQAQGLLEALDKEKP